MTLTTTLCRFSGSHRSLSTVFGLRHRLWYCFYRPWLSLVSFDDTSLTLKFPVSKDAPGAVDGSSDALGVNGKGRMQCIRMYSHRAKRSKRSRVDCRRLRRICGVLGIHDVLTFKCCIVSLCHGDSSKCELALAQFEHRPSSSNACSRFWKGVPDGFGFFVTLLGFWVERLVIRMYG